MHRIGLLVSFSCCEILQVFVLFLNILTTCEWGITGGIPILLGRFPIKESACSNLRIILRHH